MRRLLRAIWVFFCGEPEAPPVRTAPPPEALDLLDERDVDDCRAEEPAILPLPKLKSFPRIWRPDECG